MIVYICFFPQTRTPWNLRTLFGGWFQQALLKLLQCCAAQFQGAPFRPGVMGRESPGILFTWEALGWYFLGVGRLQRAEAQGVPDPPLTPEHRGCFQHLLWGHWPGVSGEGASCSAGLPMGLGCRGEVPRVRAG